jgi:hypothetical protein
MLCPELWKDRRKKKRCRKSHFIAIGKPALGMMGFEMNRNGPIGPTKPPMLKLIVFHGCNLTGCDFAPVTIFQLSQNIGIQLNFGVVAGL